MFYETELLIGLNVLALVLGIFIGRWSVGTRHRSVDPSRFADDVQARQAEGNGRDRR